MKTGFAFLILLAFAFVACNNSNKTSETGNDKATLEETTCFIMGSSSYGDDFMLQVQYMGMYYGDEAVKMAIKYGDAIEEVDENGNVEYYVLNDYYMAVGDESIYDLPISLKGSFKAWAYDDEKGMYKKEFTDYVEYEHYFAEERSGIKGVPFTIKLLDGVIVAIEEIYVP